MRIKAGYHCPPAANDQRPNTGWLLSCFIRRSLMPGPEVAAKQGLLEQSGIMYVRRRV